VLLAAIVGPSVGRHIRVNPRTKVARWWIDAVDPRLKRNHLKGVSRGTKNLPLGLCIVNVSLPQPQLLQYLLSPVHGTAVPLTMPTPYKLYGITTVTPAVSTTAVYNYRGAAVALAVRLCYRDRALVPAVIYIYRGTADILCYVLLPWHSQRPDLCVLLPWYSRNPNCYAQLPWAVRLNHHIMVRLAYSCTAVTVCPVTVAQLLGTVTWHTGLFPFVLYCYRGTVIAQAVTSMYCHYDRQP
jgi:hypothetical protein